MIDDKELIAGFIEEAQQHLSNVEPDLLEMEQHLGEVEKEVVNRIFRAIHSIKGAAGFFGFQNISTLSHEMESLLSLMREGKMQITEDVIDVLLDGVDLMNTMVNDVASSEEVEIEEAVEAIKKVRNGGEDEKSGKKQEEKTPATKTEQEPAPDDNAAELIEEFELDEELLKKVARSGEYLYKVTVGIQSVLAGKGDNLEDYFAEIGKLGRIIGSRIDESSLVGLEACFGSDPVLIFLFATVLDPDLANVGLELPEETISRVDISEYSRKLKEAIKKEQEKHAKSASTSASAKVKQETQKPEEQAQAAKAEDDEKEKPEKTKDKKPAAKIAQVQTDEKLRVSVRLLNDLVDLAGELVLSRNQLLQTTLPLAKEVQGLNPILQSISWVTSEMQERIMHLRMQPVSLLFGKFPRVVRDLSKQFKKEIVLASSGEEVELDKSIIEALVDPLTHLIRNSVDHAIESPDEREKLGKPRQGHIRLEAYHEGGQVHIDIVDDGKGIDPEKIAASAIKKGLIDEDEAGNMSDLDKVRLIFRPGFSTAEKITSVSGRGVGMDVVITNIEQIGGTVDIQSQVGEGTRMGLMLPLTLAIITGLVVRVGDQRFILPQANLEELVRIRPHEINERINKVQGVSLLRLRDTLIPLVYLEDVLFHGDINPIEKTNGHKPLNILIIRAGEKTFAAKVDAVESMEEIVVKPLPRFLQRMKSFSGTTIMGDGSVAMILDPPGIAGLVKLENLGDKMKSHVDDHSAEEQEQTGEILNLLVFDNGASERFALPLNLITRIEKISYSDIEWLENKPYYQYRKQKLRLLMLEDYLPVQAPHRDDSTEIGIIIPKIGGKPIGVVINRIIDTVETTVELDTKTIIAPGLFGSAIIKERITLMPDLYRLFEMAEPSWFGQEEFKKEKLDRKPRILVVDDTPFFRMVERDYLESASYEVHTAEDGEKALEKLAEHEYDAVILDILMPRLDGWGVIEEMRKDQRWKNIPVLAVTSLGDEASLEKGKQLGFTDWESKLNKDRILQKIDRMISQTVQS